MDSSYKIKIALANIAKQMDRYDDMLYFMEEPLNNEHVPLSEDGSDLVMEAFEYKHNFITHQLRKVVEQETKTKTITYLSYIKEYKEKIIKELESICNAAINVINKQISIIGNNPYFNDFKARYLRTKSRFYKHLGDYQSDDDLKINLYKEAIKLNSESQKIETEFVDVLYSTINISELFANNLKDKKSAIKAIQDTFTTYSEKINALENLYMYEILQNRLTELLNNENN